MFGNCAPKRSAICGKDEFVGAGGGGFGHECVLRHAAKSIRSRAHSGGSSSGSAVAVANDEADVAFGTDTAGSIRVPAACCGVVGLKTTFGLVPIDGVYPIAPNRLDTIGPLAKDIAGTVRGMDLLQAGFSARYRQAVAAKPSANGLRIGRVYVEGTNPNVDRAVDDAMAATGFKVVNLSREFTNKWIQAQKDAATVAAVGAWLYDQKFKNESRVTIRTK